MGSKVAVNEKSRISAIATNNSIQGTQRDRQSAVCSAMFLSRKRPWNFGRQEDARLAVDFSTITPYKQAAAHTGRRGTAQYQNMAASTRQVSESGSLVPRPYYNLSQPLLLLYIRLGCIVSHARPSPPIKPRTRSWDARLLVRRM